MKTMDPTRPLTLEQCCRKAAVLQRRLVEKNGPQDGFRLLTELAEEVGEVAEAVKAEAGAPGKEKAEGKIGSELADVLFSVFVLADAYGVDLEGEYIRVLEGIEKRYL